MLVAIMLEVFKLPALASAQLPFYQEVVEANDIYNFHQSVIKFAIRISWTQPCGGQLSCNSVITGSGNPSRLRPVMPTPGNILSPIRRNPTKSAFLLLIIGRGDVVSRIVAESTSRGSW